MTTQDLQLDINCDMNDFVSVTRRLGNAARAASLAFQNEFVPSVVNALKSFQRVIRTSTGAWYRRMYWKAAYATADRFPEWVSPD